MGNQSVFQNAKVFLNRAAGHLGVIGDVGVIDQFAITQGCHLEESAESGNVAREAFSRNFLLKVSSGIGLQVLLSIIREVNRRKQPPVQSPQEVDAYSGPS